MILTSCLFRYLTTRKFVKFIIIEVENVFINLQPPDVFQSSFLFLGMGLYFLTYSVPLGWILSGGSGQSWQYPVCDGGSTHQACTIHYSLSGFISQLYRPVCIFSRTPYLYALTIWKAGIRMYKLRYVNLYQSFKYYDYIQKF